MPSCSSALALASGRWTFDDGAVSLSEHSKPATLVPAAIETRAVGVSLSSGCRTDLNWFRRSTVSSDQNHRSLRSWVTNGSRRSERSSNCAVHSYRPTFNCRRRVDCGSLRDGFVLGCVSTVLGGTWQGCWGWCSSEVTRWPETDASIHG